MLQLIPFLLAWLFYLGLASVGHKFFIHKFYVSKLLQLFEIGDRRVKKVSQDQQQTRERKRKISLIQEGVNVNKLNQGEEDNGQDSDTDSAFSDDGLFQQTHDHVPKSFNRHRSMSLRLGEQRHELDLSTVYEFGKLGIQAIVDDEVTKRFAAKELKTWNLLTRTNKIHHYRSARLFLIWFSGFIFRYIILLPIRVTITMFGVSWLILCTALIGLIPESYLKRTIYYYVSIMCFRILSRGFSGVITYHNEENRAKSGGICVANHTSPIDVVVIHCDNSYALVGQKHGGFLGVLQRALARATHHIWFDRFEMSDRLAVSNRLREHAHNKNKLPILIFPEGTCINNSCVMMFKKGSFEIGATIYPVAIKYDARFGDPFWNSSKYGYVRYLLMMATSWAIVCDVWYLPPMTRQENESAIEFANRVKKEIAKKGGLVDLEWDGQLKRQTIKPELVKQQQFKFSKSIDVDSHIHEHQQEVDSGNELGHNDQSPK